MNYNYGQAVKMDTTAVVSLNGKRSDHHSRKHTSCHGSITLISIC
jgi:hypothetical protein